MKRLLKQMKWETLLSSSLYIVLGVVALVIPDTMVKTLGYLIGILLIVAGAVSMICYLLREASQNYYRNDFGYGLVGIAVGILFLYKVEWIISLVPVILGILVVASGCRKLQDVIDMKRLGYGNWVTVLILAAVNVVLGVALIANSLDAALLFLQLVGAGLIFSGVTDIATCFYLAKMAKGHFDDLNAVDSTFAEVVDEDGQKD
ncbi:MAG: hypothetical protein HFH97_19875 [Lachnospiraceae bacterium]|jgi:uncharacterized membrane protein HdeD (DUF308 family)|nr:DUF308 domain-containing protein [uncultured Acetatifactor sp.]MCI9232327.1 hypothetical protein [Lachnospiraceae bacterium]MCI9574823.1 hypothetical protein [Lachnospiraceae bacterium]